MVSDLAAARSFQLLNHKFAPQSKRASSRVGGALLFSKRNIFEVDSRLAKSALPVAFSSFREVLNAGDKVVQDYVRDCGRKS
jgi:hypothetical protein